MRQILRWWLMVLALGAGGCTQKSEPEPAKKTPAKQAQQAPAGPSSEVNGIPLAELEGTYKGDWGTMHLTFVGGEARASYDHDNGLFVGQATATGIRGVWCQDNSSGAAEFKFSRGNGGVQLDGRWNRKTAPESWMEDWDLSKQPKVAAVLAARAKTAVCQP